MNEAAITRYIIDTFAGVDVASPPGSDDRFYIWDPAKNLADHHRWPFATLVASDAYDAVSNLNRPGVFRLNIGLRKGTSHSLFGAGANASDAGQSAHDYAALDTLMAHPVYAAQYWVCVLSPSDETFEKTVKPLLAEAYELVRERFGKHVQH